MILIVDMNEKWLGSHEFVLPLCRIVEPEEYEVLHYSEIRDVTNYEKIILSGTPLKDNGYLRNITLFEWMKTCDVPVLGICAGMQVIGLVFGSELVFCEEIGMTEVETVRENPLFSSTFEAYELHTYGITPSDAFDVLAISEKCIQGIKLKGKEMYGVLFHPEVRNKDIIEQFSLHLL